MKLNLNLNVFDAALNRLQEVYEAGHTVVISQSGGKDSTICMELAIMAADAAGKLPINVVHRDEEILFPNTYEYLDRVAQRPEVNMHHLYAGQPVVNVFNRNMPYWWIFDDQVNPDDWVRKPPDYAYKIEEQNINGLVTPERFPVAEGKDLMACIGLRVQESPNRRMGLFSSKGHITKENHVGVKYIRPIYDWTDDDVWKAIQDFKWDYNRAYDVMVKHGRSKNALRIAPLTMTTSGIPDLQLAQKGWPRWFDRVCHRLDGIRTVAQFGKIACQPIRKSGESWEDCFKRECIQDAPDWIAERAEKVMKAELRRHIKQGGSEKDFPQIKPLRANPNGSWKKLALNLYNGDPFSLKCNHLNYMEPEYFRQGAGTWGGKPTF
tara:strand:- start:90 stop:1226 length:1137 start_codon:yes stop_codon:yes gene_type:complete